ncbi:DUF883 family protein [Caballeronia glathei]|jgi:ElaB/YqjD/DUF883 family membrane-anchored ribosome-binding protein|uniref:DUF883 domain-containing protein n=1 Tax=Caballeronia glathei TaxID=60547 RepID=A0A069PKG6_9BURK|nr:MULTISPECIES: DUF883 family protein [Burkholderiaceae]KDR37806.1 hypothetical protein BG61_07020 [Caballeronia glathei]TCK33682.1 uncharacterized protein DUF883 [Paraburkholderia sp. BL8N3]
MDNEKSEYAGSPEGPVLARADVAKAMREATGAASGTGQDTGPVVLAQPPVTGSAHKGSEFTPSRKPALTAAKEALSNAQDTVRAKYRVASDSTDDFVHDSPWKAIAMAALGGIIVGMLVAR